MTHTSTLEGVWSIARAYAADALQRSGVDKNEYPPEDLASDLILQWERNGTLQRYDASRSALQTFVVYSLRRLALTWKRDHPKRESPSLYCNLVPDTLTPSPPESCEILLGYILNVVKDRKIAKGRPGVVGGEEYPPTVHSVLRLISQGHSYADISKFLSLDRTLVRRVAKAEVDKVKGLKELL